jgi:hypothetical protein
MAQNRLQNLIEHVTGTENRYLFMDATEGTARSRQQLIPDSPEWFIWLAGLPSFHFHGKQGHFTARQERKPRGETYWYAYRKAHNLQHKRYLGTTEKLTLAHLEDTAHMLREAALGSLPDNQVLNARQTKHAQHSLAIGPLIMKWDNGALVVRTPTELHVLNRRQAAELLGYLYDHRGTILKSME